MADEEAREDGAGSIADVRRHERVVVAWRARIMAPAGPIEARVVDLSEGGLGMISEAAPGPVKEVEVWVAIPATAAHTRYQALRVRGRIAFQVYSSAGCRLGLQFTTVDDATLKELRRFLVKVPRPAL